MLSWVNVEGYGGFLPLSLEQVLLHVNGVPSQPEDGQGNWTEMVRATGAPILFAHKYWTESLDWDPEFSTSNQK